jgi:hypothetical protein
VADDFDPGTPVGNPAGYMADAWERGLSGRAALQEFRDAGGAMRDSYFRELYAQVGDSLTRRGSIGDVGMYDIPDPNQYSTWSMGKGGQFATQVEVSFRDKDTGIFGTKDFTYVTDEAHTKFEAESAAWDEYADPDNADEYDQVAQGTRTINMYQTVAWSP